MARRVIFGWVLLLGGVIASCSDATVPAGSIRVTPDTVHVAQGQEASFSILQRTPPLDPTRVVQSRLDLESEVAPGEWRPVADVTNPGPYLTGAPADASSTAADGVVTTLSPRQALINPGRYRVRYILQVSTANASSSSSEVFDATSNVFVVVSP
jgi:hypothetical protein